MKIDVHVSMCMFVIVMANSALGYDHGKRFTWKLRN